MTWELISAPTGAPRADTYTVRFGLTPKGQATEYLSDAFVRSVRERMGDRAIYMQHYIDRPRGRLRMVFGLTPEKGALKMPRAGNTINRYMAVEVLGITTPDRCIVTMQPVSADGATWEGDIPEPFASRIRPTQLRERIA